MKCYVCTVYALVGEAAYGLGSASRGTAGRTNDDWGKDVLPFLIVCPLSSMVLLRANCLTRSQLSVRSECYFYSYHSAFFEKDVPDWFVRYLN